MQIRHSYHALGRRHVSASMPRLQARHLLLSSVAVLVAQAPVGVGSQTATVKGIAAQVNAPRRADIHIRFVDTDVSEVLQALGMRTKDNIIYAGQGKKSITINVNAATTDEALRYITSASGLAFRQVGNSYVVAPAAMLRQAIEPMGEQMRVPLTTLTPTEAVKAVEEAFPYVTVRPAGSQVLLIGSTEDLQQAQELLRQQNSIRVPDPPTSEVVILQNVNAAQAVTLLKSLYPDLKVEAIGDATKPGGSIGLAGPGSQILRAKQSLSTIDSGASVKEVDHVFRIYNIKYSSARVLRAFLHTAAPTVEVMTGPENYSPPRPTFNPITGATLGTASTSVGGATSGSSSGSSTSTGGTSGSGSVIDSAALAGSTGTGSATQQVNDRAKTLVLSGTTRDVSAVVALLEQVDTPPRQVSVEVKVVDVTPQFNDALGVQYGFASVAVTNQKPGATIDPTTGQGTATVGFNSTTFSRLPVGFGAQISALAQRTHSKLLANPRIQVIDNDDANIFIGDTIRTQIAQSGISGTTIQVLEFPVGIILLVRPRINADGRVTMRIHPVVSTVTSIGPGNIPNTSNREAETTVMVQDGETIVIGGLIRDEFTKSLQEVPILSRLPLVGELFRYHSNSRRRSEVQVFITPHINDTGQPLNAVERNNAAATTVEGAHMSSPNPQGSGLPADPHGELPKTKKP